MKRSKRIDTSNIRIQPVKFMTKQQYELCISLFAAEFPRKINSIPYEDAVANNELVMMYDGNRMIGFMHVLDIMRVVANAGPKFEGASDFFIDTNRTVNRKQIELVWINRQYRNCGLATMFYRYGVQVMGCTQVHVDPERVFPRMEYWYELGFTKFVLNKFCSGAPTLKLHIEDSSDHLHDLSIINLIDAHADRGIAV